MIFTKLLCLCSPTVEVFAKNEVTSGFYQISFNSSKSLSPMNSIPQSLERLIKEFSKLPGIGRKTAQRLAYHILKQPREEVVLFAQALVEVKDSVHFCTVCFNFAEKDLCSICADLNRTKSIICVVEKASDIPIVERSGKFTGTYHVLSGLLSPLNRIGPDNLHIKELLRRLESPVNEIILALNPSIEGEATSLYLIKLIKPIVPHITRLAQGLPVGSELEFADELTLSKAFEGRVKV